MSEIPVILYGLKGAVICCLLFGLGDRCTRPAFGRLQQPHNNAIGREHTCIIQKQNGTDIEMQAIDKKELRSELEKRFKEIDADGSGTIDKNEVTTELRNKFRDSITPADLDQLWLKFDANNNGVLELEEFVSMGEAIADGSLGGRLGDKMRTLLNIGILQKHKKKIFGMSMTTIGVIVAVVVIGAAAGGAAAASGGGGGDDSSDSSGTFTPKVPTSAEERASLQSQISTALSIESAEAVPSTTTTSSAKKKSSWGDHGWSQKSGTCTPSSSCKCQAQASASFCSGCSTGSGCNGCDVYCEGETRRNLLPVDAPVRSTNTEVRVQDPALEGTTFVQMVSCFLDSSGMKEYAINKTTEHYALLEAGKTSSFTGVATFRAEFDAGNCDASNSEVQMESWDIKATMPLVLDAAGSINEYTDYTMYLSWASSDTPGTYQRVSVVSEVVELPAAVDGVDWYISKQTTTWLMNENQTGFIETTNPDPTTTGGTKITTFWQYTTAEINNDPFILTTQYKSEGGDQGLTVSRQLPMDGMTSENYAMIMDCINNGINTDTACDARHNGALIQTYWLKYNANNVLRVVNQNMSDTYCMDRYSKTTLYKDYSLYDATDGELVSLVTSGHLIGPAGGQAYMSNHGMHCQSDDCSDLADGASVTFEVHTNQGEEDYTGTLNIGDTGRLKRETKDAFPLAEIAGTELLTHQWYSMSGNSHYVMYDEAADALVKSSTTEYYCSFLQCTCSGSCNAQREGPTITNTDYSGNMDACAAAEGTTIGWVDGSGNACTDGSGNFDSRYLVSTGEMVHVATRSVRLATPTPFNVTATEFPWGLGARSPYNHNLYMQIGLQYTGSHWDSNDPLGVAQPDGATTVKISSEGYMNPTTSGAPTTLWCYGENCPKGGCSNANDASNCKYPQTVDGNGNTVYTNETPHPYTFNAATSTLTDDTAGVAVDRCNFVDCSDSNSGHDRYGPFITDQSVILDQSVTPAVYLTREVEDRATEIFWWYPQRLYSLTEASSGDTLTLDDEPSVLYKHDSSAGPGNSGVSYDGSYFALTYGGPGNLHGFPSVKVENQEDVTLCGESCSWPYYSDINIPALAYMTNMVDDTGYFGVASSAEEFLHLTASPSTCDSLRATIQSESLALPLPTKDDYVAPANAAWYGTCTNCDVMYERMLQKSSGVPEWSATFVTVATDYL